MTVDKSGVFKIYDNTRVNYGHSDKHPYGMAHG